MFNRTPALGWCPAVSGFEGLQASSSNPALISPACSSLSGVRNWRFRPRLRSASEFRGPTERLNLHRSRLPGDRGRGQSAGHFRVRGFGIEDRSSGCDDDEELGQNADGRDDSASADVYTPLYNANDVLDWPLMRDVSETLRGAMRQYVYRKVGDLPSEDFQVMIQTDRAAIFMMMIKAMHEGFGLRSAELRLEWQHRFELPLHPPRVKPEIILTQQDRDNASPRLRAWIEQVEERAVVTERKVRALDAMTEENKLVVFHLGLTSEDKAEFINCTQRCYLDRVFSWNANCCLTSLDIHPIIKSANVWYFPQPEHGSSEGNTMTEPTCCIKAGRDYIHTLIAWGMYLGIFARNLQLAHDLKCAQEQVST